MIILPEKHQPSTLQIKAFSLCLFFWSPTLYTVLFDHAYPRLPRHQSTVWARTQCPTETWAEIYLFDGGCSNLFYFLPCCLPPVGAASCASDPRSAVLPHSPVSREGSSCLAKICLLLGMFRKAAQLILSFLGLMVCVHWLPCSVMFQSGVLITQRCVNIKRGSCVSVRKGD